MKFSLDMGFTEFASHYNVENFDPTKPTVIPLNSTAVYKCSYNPASENLTVWMQDGSVITYLLVSMSDFWGLVTAPSVGRYFNEYIRNQHTFTYGDESWLSVLSE